MLRFLLIMSFVLTSSPIFSKESAFKIAGKFYQFKQKDNLLITKSCNKGCIALKQIKNIIPFKRKASLEKRFSEPLGAYVCKNIIKGRPLLGIDQQKNMKSFCYFPKDSSMIEMNSLEEYSKKFLSH